jgi:uncharacterized protein (DUF1697 family)
MTVAISMLRGVNLGPHRRIKMDALREVYESLGLKEPQTYVQSGNVLFKTRAQKLEPLAKRIEDAFERRFGFRADVIVRTSSELREVIAKNPFAARKGLDPARLLVTFLATDPGEEARARIRQIKAEPEELWIEGRELFIYFPNGLARPKLSIPLIERTLKTSGTGRNWNSVQKLLEMAESMEG